ncbi:FUSC family protein [Variovorax sp. J22R133]|uniref:FUSC family protein n=1 Tax=Variovorax brevis TaxID=3053503 RepID=UPI00257826E0|nr:FUSC family protein [Variovorax sp. J22R133]MDM0117460.1 FUSC family protein [Variovorax sp. J22R133]
MSAFNTRGVIYATNCTLAALLALWIAFSAGLPNPGWASLTVFIVSQPLGAASGSVVSRALYRTAGTVTGVIASMLILPALVQTPGLMIAAVAAWVALCIYLSLLDRSPRSYAFLLAGYTVALVGLPMVGDVSQLFDTGIARIEEIVIGAFSAALMHSLLFPRTLKSQMQARLEATLKDARTWMTVALSPQGASAVEQAARRRMAADLTELNQLANGQRFDADTGPADSRIVSALETRLVALLPLMTAVEDRLGAIAQAGDMPPALARYAAEVRQWIGEATQGDQDRGDHLVAAARQASPANGALPAWTEMLAASAVQRLAELVEAWNDCLHLMPFVRDPHLVQDSRVRQLADAQPRRRLHVDHGLAAFAGLAAGVAVALAGAVAIVTGWAQGTAMIGIAAAGSSVFAFIDDPRPMQKLFIAWSLIAVPVAALYVFAILPAVDGFGAFALVMSPLFFGTALYLTTPQHWLRALGFALVSQTLLALQPALRADFESFTTVAVGTVTGGLIALLVTSLMHVVSPETSASRILRAGWRELAALAAGRASSVPDAASRMLDRVGMLIPRLARLAGNTEFQRADALNDLRLGVNTATLREVAQASGGGPVAPAIDALMGHLANHFGVQSRRGHVPPGAEMLVALDNAIVQILALGGAAPRLKGLVAATGLRRGLFPDAPPFDHKEYVPC